MKMIKVNAIGRLTKEVDLRFTSSGRMVGNFTLACDRGVDGNGNQKVTYIKCTQWNKPAETLANFTTKGTLLGVHGDLVSSSYDKQNGEKAYTMELEVDSYEFLEPKETTDQRKNKQNQERQQQYQQQNNQQQSSQNWNQRQQPNFNTPR